MQSRDLESLLGEALDQRSDEKHTETVSAGWSRNDRRWQRQHDVVASKLESGATRFTAEEMVMVDIIADLAKHKYLLGETRFHRYEIRACGSARKEVHVPGPRIRR